MKMAPSGKATLSHRELVEKAHFQASWQSPASPNASRSLSMSLQESQLLSPHSRRLLSPRDPVSPISPETTRVYDSIAPEDSPMHHSRLQSYGGPTPTAAPVRRGSAWARPRSADQEARQSERWRCIQAELRLRELAKQLRTTKAALMASEKRADQSVGGISPSSWTETRSRLLAPEVYNPGSNSFGSTTASVPIRDLSMYDKTQLAVSTVPQDRDMQQQEAEALLRPLSKNERVLNEIKREHDVVVAVEEAKIQAREVASVEARYKANVAERELILVKEENALLKQQVHVLEQTLQTRASTSENQDCRLREVKEERELKVETLERELAGQRARVQDILTQLHRGRDEKALVVQEKNALEQTLSDKTRDLEKAGHARGITVQAYEERLEQLSHECNAIAKEAEDAKRAERLHRDKEVGVARAEAKNLQHKCRDEQRSAVFIQEQLEKERRDKTVAENSKNEVTHMLNELNDQRTVEMQRSSIDLQNLEAFAQNTQIRLRSELEEAQLQAKSLRVQLDERERQLQDAHDIAGGHMIVRDQANAQRLEVLDDLRQSKALIADLQRALADAVREKEAILRQSTEKQKHCEAERDLFQQRSFVLKTALNEVEGNRHLYNPR